MRFPRRSSVAIAIAVASAGAFSSSGAAAPAVPSKVRWTMKITIPTNAQLVDQDYSIVRRGRISGAFCSNGTATIRFGDTRKPISLGGTFRCPGGRFIIKGRGYRYIDGGKRIMGSMLLVRPIGPTFKRRSVKLQIVGVVAKGQLTMNGTVSPDTSCSAEDGCAD